MDKGRKLVPGKEDTVYVRFVWGTGTQLDFDMLALTKLAIIAKVTYRRKLDISGVYTEIGSAVAIVEVNTLAMRGSIQLPAQTLREAVEFAIAHLNPVLENMAILFGIANSVDVAIEHRLRQSAGTLKHLTLRKELS